MSQWMIPILVNNVSTSSIWKIIIIIITTTTITTTTTNGSITEKELDLFDDERYDEFMLVGSNAAMDNLQCIEQSSHIAEGHRNYCAVLVQKQVVEREKMLVVIPLPHAVVKLFFSAHRSDLRAHVNLKSVVVVLQYTVCISSTVAKLVMKQGENCTIA